MQPLPVEAPKPSILPLREKSAEIDHTDSELPDAQSVVLADIAREARARNLPPVKTDEIAAAMHFLPFPEYDISLSLERDPKIVLDETAELADLDPKNAAALHRRGLCRLELKQYRAAKTDLAEALKLDPSLAR